ncbi:MULTISPECIES: FAD-binding oxidoreductase [unclassified Streptomyces]|uniref:FAD-binding oxidoreductase n=1 Tax=unclassified Streptomyces TaxID=2593676 RepID=UPI0038223641
MTGGPTGTAGGARRLADRGRTVPRSRAVVVDHSPVDDDLCILRLAPERPLSFSPGQYVTVGVTTADGTSVERPYSLVSSPSSPILELFVERVAGGQASEPLCDLRSGGTVALRERCKGLLLNGCDLGAPRTFVATATGIAPFVSFVRAAARGDIPVGPTGRVLLLHGARRSARLGYAEELAALDRRHEWLTYVPVVSRRAEDAGWPGEFGRVEDILRKHTDAGDFVRGAGASAHLCGNPTSVDLVRRVLLRAGLEGDRIATEQFWMA